MDEYVEAIEEGKIVRVLESYAKREGLPILRKSSVQEVQEKSANQSQEFSSKVKEENKRSFSEYLQNPKNWKKSQVTSELIENFHWQIRAERKKKNLTRRQLAKLLNEKEENIKLIEAGIFPANDFILVNKIQEKLGINLRKDKKDFTKGVSEMMSKAKPTESSKDKFMSAKSNYFGNDIEIFEDEI